MDGDGGAGGGGVLSLYLNIILIIVINPLKLSFIPSLTQHIFLEHLPWAGRYSGLWGLGE